MSMTTMNTKPSENLNIVIVGHVDHGKSTLLGRLYADTGSLPDGKLEKVQAICKQQGKEFEYAFLFDAFLEEQEQGITIDTARISCGRADNTSSSMHQDIKNFSRT
jgi:bifunctional enzyme CysN/CysC